MLGFLRKKENIKKIMWGLAIVIIPAFVLWGAGSAVRSRGLPQYAGRIFGRKVSFRQYEKAFLACRNQALFTYGQDLEKMIEFLDLEEQAWQRLILLHQAEKEKIKVSNEEVITLIRQMPLFQQEGRFSHKLYAAILNYTFRTSPREFEEQIRGSIKIEKLTGKIVEKVRAEEQDIEMVYRNEQEKARALYVFIDPEGFQQQIHPAYEKLQEYYQNNKRDFRKPEQVNAQYIGLYLEREKAPVEITGQEIEDYYQQHLQEFSQPGKNDQELIQPLKEVKERIGEKLSNQKLQWMLEDKMWQISEELGDDAQSFEQVAEKNQLEIKESGFFTPQQAIPEIGLSYEFSNTAFESNPGQVSNVIQTPKGYFILKVKEKKPSFIPDLIDIKQKVETAYIKEASWELALKEGQRLLAEIKQLIEQKNLNFKQAAQKLSLEVKQSEEFTRISYIPEIGQGLEFSRAAFSLEPGEVSNLIKIPNGYCILTLLEIIPADMEKLAEEKESFRQKVLARKKSMVYQVWLAKLKELADLKSNIGKQPAP